MTDGIFEQFGNSYRISKNITKVNRWPTYSFTVSTNSLGFRDRAPGTRNITDKPYALVMGSSDTFANGVDYEDSFVGLIDEAASKKGMEVLNMAAGGHKISDQLLLFKDFMATAPAKPSVIYFCMNPLLIYTFNKEESIIVRDGYLFENESWRTAYVRLILGNLSSAYCIFRDNIRKIQLRLNESHFREAKSFLDLYSKNNQMHTPEILKQFEEQMDAFLEYCRQNAMPVVFIYLPIVDGFRLGELLAQLGQEPDGYDTSYYEEVMRAYCSKRNLRLINATPVLKSHHDRGEQLTFRFEPHYNKEANSIIGEFLINELFRQ